MTPQVPEPPRLQRRPHDRHGRPVPWFAIETAPGEYDFRVADAGKARDAVRLGLCWVCGFPFLRQEVRAFTSGPMCAVNRTSAEPPAHEDCATYSARACPFLNRPNMTRRDRHLPEGTVDPGGIMLMRNPGVALVWVTTYKGWRQVKDHRKGYVFDMGDPLRVAWWARGVAATREEVLASMSSGLPALAEIAATEEGASEVLAAGLARALEWVPPGDGPLPDIAETVAEFMGALVAGET